MDCFFQWQSGKWCGGQNRVGSHFGRCSTHFRAYFSGDLDVHWGHDLDFDPWPNGACDPVVHSFTM